MECHGYMLEMQTGYPDGGPSLEEEVYMEQLANEEKRLEGAKEEFECLEERYIMAKHFPKKIWEDIKEHYDSEIANCYWRVHTAKEQLARAREPRGMRAYG